jgi:hypothetical protein
VRKRSLCEINKFEPVFNTAAATQMVFQRLVNQDFLNIPSVPAPPFIFFGDSHEKEDWVRYLYQKLLNLLGFTFRIDVP